MEAIWQTVSSDPLYYIGAILAFWAAIGFLTFLRGLLSGLPHFFKYDGNDGTLPNHRHRAIWGVVILTSAFGLWELTRWSASLITGSGDALSIWFILLLTIFIWLPPLWTYTKELIPGKKK